MAPNWKWLLLLPACCVLIVFGIAVGMVVTYSFRPNFGLALVGEGWTLENFSTFLLDPYYRDYIVRSLRVAAYCTAATLVLGYPVAFVMAVSQARLRTAITIIVVSQFFTAYVIRSFAFVAILGRAGMINQVLLYLGIIERPLRIMFTEAAVAIGLTVVALPFMILPVYSAISSIPDNVERAAQSLGASRTRTFWHVFVPLSLPGIVAGSVLVFLFCFTSYVIPAILGGIHFPMIGNLIAQQAMEVQNFPFAAAAAVVALMSSLTVVFCIQKLFDRHMKQARA